MNRFSLPHPTRVTVDHVNIGDEQHGDESVLRVDVKLSLETGNDVLTMFDADLLPACYMKSTKPVDPPPQGALALEDPPALPDLRWPQLAPLQWKEDLQRTVTLEHGLGVVTIADATLNEFRLDRRQGGTVKVTWRMQRTHPTDDMLLKIPQMLKQEVRCTVVASPETQALIDEQPAEASTLPASFQNKPKKSRRMTQAEAREAATAAFVDAHGAQA